jgi:hypothetical protein
MRLETGVVQCGDDWPGIFIRGDNAFALAADLRHVLAALPETPDFYTRLSVSQVDGLVKLLMRSNTHAEGHAIDQFVHLSVSPTPSGTAPSKEVETK